jgi:hypothetical protein
LITTEIPSNTPLKNKAKSDTQNIVERPNTIIQIPKAKIAVIVLFLHFYSKEYRL